MLMQALTHLGTYWSVNFRSIVALRSVSDIKVATLVKVLPRKATEKAGICELEHITLKNESGTPVQVGMLTRHANCDLIYRARIAILYIELLVRTHM